MWDEIWEWINSFISHFVMDVFTYPCCDESTYTFPNLGGLPYTPLQRYIKHGRWRITAKYLQVTLRAYISNKGITWNVPNRLQTFAGHNCPLDLLESKPSMLTSLASKKPAVFSSQSSTSSCPLHDWLVSQISNRAPMLPSSIDTVHQYHFISRGMDK